ncbi:restriction endonuclease [Variovorax sp. IB41]|uniref:restriction endonuclease n=1 Tax=Variovorax sp. IB41 TaxID=2779370 RepID=UPI0018E90041|nr:restriction endonuclease [Variovorax sp. IB41]MBJ2156604.1 restriction endonuclease [Variovorax sp. IB41]
MHWSDYQKQAKQFFASIGLDARIEFELQGARGTHVIDVFATGSYGGIGFKWVIECKAWKSNIPKEKVMALAAIVQDVGADRGFLLSEVGFQSGALLAARSSNITLTSLEDLSQATDRFAIDLQLGQTTWVVRKAKSRLMELKRKSDEYEYDFNRLRLSSELSVCELLLQDASEGKYPVLYATKGIQFQTLEEVIAYTREVVDEAKQWDLP